MRTASACTRRCAAAPVSARRLRAAVVPGKPMGRRRAPAGIGAHELGAFTGTRLRHRHRVLPELWRSLKIIAAIEDPAVITRILCIWPCLRVHREAPRRGCRSSSRRPDPKAPQRFCHPGRRPGSARGCANRSHCAEATPLSGRGRAQAATERGKFSPNTGRLTAEQAADTVAVSKKGGLKVYAPC